MKIVHLTVTRQLTAGQTKQLAFEHAASSDLQEAEWTTIAVHEGEITQPFMKSVPFLLRGQFLRKLYGWVLALQLSRECDIVMMRHMTFDPFAFIFAPLIRNRVSVHHAKEIEELKLIRQGWKGKAASTLERFSGRFAVRHTKMILGVTQEIADYERDLHCPNKPAGCYPNGIDSNSVRVLDDGRKKDEIHAAFMCGTFSSWHGLDKLIDAVDMHEAGDDDLPLTVHLIGRLSDEQVHQLNATPQRREVFKCHGLLDVEEYRPILTRCDVGIASLALERENLTEGSTLKVREMLAMGLPVYSGHHDVALAPDKPFVAVVKEVSVSDLRNFALETKYMSRHDVRQKSLDRISKATAMKAVVQMLFFLEKP